ncbi:polymer-forming cytoskeletal protein [Kordiimonas sp. SCSIO 12603]|uniref:bactofilin family protein n=1 Tax=Kordiimonas sp. SCSIO 12603 TaxID=2829596 RepID=UPI00210214E7|nr:polymer-forming cytoskeletal protein [Kordiimonas sp. SCSIO 12603]UTW57322.1 polymer-forming cytoskeletal protein [Kordiimonas sp. SCSIO 12603]
MKKPANNSGMTARASATATPSIIGSDVQIEGNIRTIGELQLDGNIIGDLACGGLVMGETGSVKGTITADNVTIRGKVNGEVRARSVRLEKSSVVEGDIYHESLSVEAGAKLTGHFAHTNSPTEAKSDKTETPSFVAKKEAAE